MCDHDTVALAPLGDSELDAVTGGRPSTAPPSTQQLQQMLQQLVQNIQGQAAGSTGSASTSAASPI
jgi:hypothetical protein